MKKHIYKFGVVFCAVVVILLIGGKMSGSFSNYVCGREIVNVYPRLAIYDMAVFLWLSWICYFLCTFTLHEQLCVLSYNTIHRYKTTKNWWKHCFCQIYFGALFYFVLLSAAGIFLTDDYKTWLAASVTITIHSLLWVHVLIVSVMILGRFEIAAMLILLIQLGGYIICAGKNVPLNCNFFAWGMYKVFSSKETFLWGVAVSIQCIVIIVTDMLFIYKIRPQNFNLISK